MADKRVIGWDVETFPIAEGVAFPQLVCVSWDDGVTKGVMLDDEGLVWLRKQLEDPDVVLVAHNTSYDAAVAASEDETLIPLIFRAVFEGRICCTKIREKIIQNADGELYYEWDEESESYKGSSFTLQRLVLKHFDKFLKKKDDSWQFKYGLLYRVPVAEWPQDAIDYAISDSTWARALYFKQEESKDGDVEEIPGAVHVTCTAMALALLSAHGVRTDGASVSELKIEIERDYEFWVKKAQEAGLVRTPRFNKKGVMGKRSRDMKAIKKRVAEIYTRFGLRVPPTEKGDVCTDRETLTFGGAEAKKLPRLEKVDNPDPNGKPIPCVDARLKYVSEVVRTQKLLTTYVPTLEHGVLYPITPSYNEMVETYRTSCSKPNLQNQGRGGGVRKCYIPRPGAVFAFCDYDSLEMRTLAQTCIDLFGYSFIANAIFEGKDLHVEMATETLGGMDYGEAMKRYAAGDKVIEDVRQGSKIANYGMAGGMGPDAFVDYARGYGVEMTRERAVELHQAFRKKWRETNDYFNYCSNLMAGDEAHMLVHPRTGMVRGKVRYTATCNHFFQHLAAVGATKALFHAVWEMYDPTLESPLYGCRAWLFAHDEIGMEIPYAAFGPERSHAAAMRLQEVMIGSMMVLCPNVPIGATVCMARKWLKGAKPVEVNGLLVPSRQVDKKWVADTDGLPGWEKRVA